MNDDPEKKGKQAAINGFAHEYIAVGILMKKYHHVYKVTNPLSPYDIIIVRKANDSPESYIRAQVKTVSSGNSIKFIGGVRGGKDREYKSGVKEYIQSTETSDVVIGVKHLGNGNFDLFFVPTILIEILKQKSLSINRIEFLKNNYKILDECKNKHIVIDTSVKAGFIKPI